MPKLTIRQLKVLQALDRVEKGGRVGTTFTPWPTTTLRFLSRHGLIDGNPYALTDAGREAMRESAAWHTRSGMAAR